MTSNWLIICILLAIVIAPYIDARHHQANSSEVTAEQIDALLDTVTCENLDQVRLVKSFKERASPLSHGHSKGVYPATLHNVDVVLKLPIGEFLTSKFQESVNSFQREVNKIRQLRGHPGIVRLFGACLGNSRKTKLAIVTERLEPWFAFLERPLAWCTLVHTSISIVSIFEYLQWDWQPERRDEPAWLHCDLNRGQFAFTDQHEARLVDYGGLELWQTFPAHGEVRCDTVHDNACGSTYCLRSWHEHRNAQVSEFECNVKHNKCHGFDPRAMIWVVCESMLVHLLDEHLMRRRGAPNTTAVSAMMSACLNPDREQRWTAPAVGNALRQYLADNNGYECLSAENIKLNPAYYDADHQVTIDSANAKVHHHHNETPHTPPPWTPPIDGTVLKPFRGAWKPPKDAHSHSKHHTQQQQK